MTIATELPMADPISMAPVSAVRLSIVIKALNEERYIEEAVRSAVAVAEHVGGEVILADSGSTDRTVEIASRYPIRIVQLANRDERCCGIGPQLGYQHAQGAFVWIADGDQVLFPDFADRALAMLDAQADLAGVAGAVNEVVIENLEFERRNRIKPDLAAEGRESRWLSQGGIYRRSAIESVGHFSDRNLHSYEEYDLGRRLRGRNWRLVRIPVVSCDHYGHSGRSYKLLWRRLTSRYAYGSGEALRAALAQGDALRMVGEIGEIKLWLVNLAFWAAMIVLAVLTAIDRWWALPLIVVALVPLAAALVKTRNLERAVFTVASWGIFTTGFVLGWFRPRVAPDSPIASKDLSPQR
jgi:glycosyltransferase involved in cell wall biosynthesis